MKRLFDILVLTLAVNFLAIAGAVGWLYRTGRLDRARVDAIRQVLFPPAPVEAPSTQPVATTQPTLRLEELLAQYAGRPASEQLEHIRRTFDAHMAQLDRGQRELLALRSQVELAQAQLARDRARLDEDKRKQTAREQQAQKLAADEGFQNTLALYESLPPRDVKTIFMGLSDQTVVDYLRAMESRNASRIIKEFKSTEELERARKILEMMRLAQASAKEE